MKNFLILICIFISGLYPKQLSAQTTNELDSDSLTADSSNIRWRKKILDNRLYQITHIGAPLIIIGASINKKDGAFGNMRNSYLPSFRFHYDDYLQYSPGVIMLGLKAFGVEGRSSWERMLTSDAFAAGIMAVTINSLKASISKNRPDKSGNNSFPSGHTATAFMMATMLHKEYGTTRSPLYSILGYSLATGTAISRQLNNKHWFSDVMTGAGIGIVSTELGYYLADLIFKKKGLVRPVQNWNPTVESEHFSYFGLQTGYGVGEREVHLPRNIEIEGMGGVTASFTGGWFFHPHWGLSGKFTVSQVSPHIDNENFFQYHPELESMIDNFQAEPMTYTNLVAGIQFNTRLLPGIYVGGNLMGGIGWTGNYDVNIQYVNSESVNHLLHCKVHPIPNLDITAYLMNVTKRNLGIKLFINYNTGRGKAHHTYYDPDPKASPIPLYGNNRITLHNLSIGAEIAALFWK